MQAAPPVRAGARLTRAIGVHFPYARSRGSTAVNLDVLIIGAGAAGLAATRELERAGKRVLCVEARDRIGGRILTGHDPLVPVAIEFGAEFVHGRPEEIFELIAKAGLNAFELDGRMVGGGDPFRVMEDIKLFAGTRDQTLLEFLHERDYTDEEKHAAIAFIEGFEAAHADRIGIAGLAEEEQAADRIEGHRSFRILNGYHSLMLTLGVPGVQLKSVVESVEWRRGHATIHVRSATTQEFETIDAGRVLITVPLGVLQAGSIRFEPEPGEILHAARALAFGDAFRVTLRFERPFWQDKAEFSGADFILADEPLFPTWWTTLPLETSVITGWSAGPKAEPLLGKTRLEIIRDATASLQRITGVPMPPLIDAWFHDWSADPFSRGAYSYVPAGALSARARLAEPVEDTLYFAGEATDLIGYGGTVHGAIASGRRAAAQILAA
jgi:monoamine oxidase